MCKYDELVSLGYCVLDTKFDYTRYLDKVIILEKTKTPDPFAKGTVLTNIQTDLAFLDLLQLPELEELLILTLNDPYYNAIPADKPNYILGEYIARSTCKDGLPLHGDNYFPFPGKNTNMCQVVFALEDRGIDTGCTKLVPASHTSGKYADRSSPVVPLPLKAGCIAVWDSRLWHGAYPRVSEIKGWALIATLQCWWVKQRFDIPKTIESRNLTNKQKALLGCFSTPPKDETDGYCKRGYL